MSTRRSLSFAENELDLLNYFDTNGRSDIAKAAMRFYKDNKDKILISSLSEILTLIGTKPPNTSVVKNDKVQKLMK